MTLYLLCTAPVVVWFLYLLWLIERPYPKETTMTHARPHPTHDDLTLDELLYRLRRSGGWVRGRIECTQRSYDALKHAAYDRTGPLPGAALLPTALTSTPLVVSNDIPEGIYRHVND